MVINFYEEIIYFDIIIVLNLHTLFLAFAAYWLLGNALQYILSVTFTKLGASTNFAQEGPSERSVPVSILNDVFISIPNNLASSLPCSYAQQERISSFEYAKSPRRWYIK